MDRQVQPTDDPVQRNLQHLLHQVDHGGRAVMPAARYQHQPHPRPLTTSACSNTGEPSQTSAAGSGGSNAMPGASSVARVVTRTSAEGWVRGIGA